MHRTWGWGFLHIFCFSISNVNFASPTQTAHLRLTVFHLTGRLLKWMMEFKCRNNSKYNKVSVQNMIAPLMKKHFIEYKLPDYVINVEIMQVNHFSPFRASFIVFFFRWRGWSKPDEEIRNGQKKGRQRVCAWVFLCCVCVRGWRAT